MDGKNSTNTPTGAEFLKSVIGNLHRPNRKVFNARIDVDEYIPNDVKYTGHDEDLKILSKQHNNFAAQIVRKLFLIELVYFITFINNINKLQNHHHMNRPAQPADVNDDQDEKMTMFASQMVPQLVKNEFSESQQHKIVSQGSSQPISSVPNNILPQHIIDALSSKNLILKQSI